MLMLHAGAEGADAGQAELLGPRGLGGRADQLALGAEVLDGVEDRAQVAHLVVDDSDHSQVFKRLVRSR